MDPRNPLGRLDRLSRDRRVRRLVLTFDGARSGSVTRGVALELHNGRRGAFELNHGSSWVDLIDQLQGFIETASEKPSRAKKPHRRKMASERILAVAARPALRAIETN